MGRQSLTFAPSATSSSTLLPSSTPESTTPTETTIATSTPQSLPTPIGNYTGWQTYADAKAKFSIMYAPTDKIYDKKEGEFVSFTSFRMAVYGDYDGGSRREWLRSKDDLSTYDVVYEDHTVAGVNALIVDANDPASMGRTYVIIPKGSKVYLFSKTSGIESLDEVKRIISTFKFL